MNAGPFSQCFIVLPISNSLVSAKQSFDSQPGSTSTYLTQVIHVNFVQTQPKVTHTSTVDLAAQGSLSIQVLLGDWQSLTGVHLQSAPL